MQVSTRTMQYDRENQILSCDVSDFGPDFGFEQLNPHKPGTGVSVVSHRTGAVVDFHIVWAERLDGDLLYWILRPDNLVDPALEDLSLQIYND